MVSQSRFTLAKMGKVGLFGDWLEQNCYGVFLEWQVSEGAAGKNRCMVAIERDGSARVPSEAAVMEYVLVMAVGDVESRPKGGRPEYRNGSQFKLSLNGMKHGDMMGEKKEFGYGSHPNAPFRFLHIQNTVRAVVQWLSGCSGRS